MFFFFEFSLFLSAQKTKILVCFLSQELSRDSHWEIDTADDERYDIEVKVAKNERAACLCNGNEHNFVWVFFFYGS